MTLNIYYSLFIKAASPNIPNLYSRQFFEHFSSRSECKEICSLCRRSLSKRGRLDAVYEKSVRTVININPLMCHHVECEHSGERLECRGLPITICLFIKIKCMFPMVYFFVYTFMHLIYFWFDFEHSPQ